MKRLTTYIILATILVSCAKEALVDATFDESHSIAVDVVVDNIETKVDKDVKPGVAKLNENKIFTVHYYLYPKAAGQTEPEGEAVHCGFKAFSIDNLPQGSAPLSINCGDVTFSKIFPLGRTSCFLYVVVNMDENELPHDPNDPKGTSYHDLRATKITGSFSQNVAQDKFIMDGLIDEVSSFNRFVKDPQYGNAHIEIPVERVASKLELKVTVNNEASGTAKNDDIIRTWHPHVDDMRVQLRQGVKVSNLSGSYTPSSISDYFNTNQEGIPFITKDAYGTPMDSPYGTEFPLYSYPMSWGPGSDKEPYLFVVLPWSYEENGKETLAKSYYKILLAGGSYKRNTWHTINLTIGTLGSWDEERPKVQVGSKYNVADWKNALTNSDGSEGGLAPSVEAIIEDARYLVVPQTYFEVKNMRSLEFQFAASGNCSIDNNSITITKKNVNASDNRIPSKTGLVTIDNAKKKVTLTNTLQNYTTSGSYYDVVPYMFTFKIQLAADPSIYEYVTVMQYPAIYIEPDESTEYPGSNKNYGYVMVNSYGYKRSLGTGNNWYSVTSVSNGTNTDRNMYVVNISALDSGTLCNDGNPYVIGDPRDAYDNNAKPNTEMNPDDNKKPFNAEKYLGTSTSDDYAHHIAPSFRIASSYAQVSTMSKANAINRCASYQEDGLPAGRWRLPTYAEFSFINKLSGDNKLKYLFTPKSASNNGYWTANGAYIFNDQVTPKVVEKKTGNNVTAAVRCVYDEWYWNDTHETREEMRSVFTWGY